MRCTFLPLAVLMIAAAPGTGEARCKLTRPTLKRKTISGCKLVSRKAFAKRKGAIVAISADELRCGRLKLASWSKLVKTGRSSCKDAGKGADFSIGESLELLGRYKSYVGVQQDASGYTGGAHGWHNIKVRTYDTRTGKRVTIAKLFPRRAAKILATARKMFRGPQNHDSYSFDPLAFSIIAVSGGKTKLRFAMPHDVETARGTTLKIEFSVKGLPRP